jgi:hypothetical protein
MLIVSPSAAVPSTFMPLPFRNTLAGRPVVLDTALLPASVLPLSAEETRSDCLCPDGCAPRGNVRYIAATFAAATVVVPENSGRLQNQQDTGRLCHIVTWKNSGTTLRKGPWVFRKDGVRNYCGGQLLSKKLVSTAQPVGYSVQKCIAGHSSILTRATRIA